MQTSHEDRGVESPEDFASRHNIKFKDHLLLSRALTHRSFLNEHPEAIEDNERLEFLGDAVLDFVVASWLYNRFPEKTEGDLTRLRASLVKTEQLAVFSKDIAIGKALRLGKGEEDSGGREKAAMLCAAFEAVIGAIYLDMGVQAAKDFINEFIKSSIDDILTNLIAQDSKSHLQEWAQGEGFAIPFYNVISESGPDHEKTFEVEVVVNSQVIGKGTGKSKQTASKAAAAAALKSLNLLTL